MINIKGNTLEGSALELNIDLSKGEDFEIITYDDQLVVETRDYVKWFLIEGFEINTVKDAK